MALGLVLAIVALLSNARRDDRPPAPSPIAGRLVSDDDGPLEELVMHYVPEAESEIGPAYRDFLRALPETTRVVFVVRRGGRGALLSFLSRILVSLARLRIVEIDGALGAWSKDRALVLSPASGESRHELLIPPRPRAGEISRPQDWSVVPALAAALPDDFAVRTLPIAFDAGDFAIVGKRVVFDANLFARNRGRGFRSPAELRDRLATLLGRDVVMLGDESGDVPRHHMSMYMAPVGDGVVLVGDPRAGERIVGSDYAPGEVGAETHVPLHADFTPATIARFDRAADELARAGFRVLRIPTVPFEDKTYFAYTNGVYESRDGARTAWVPNFGLSALDLAANAVYANLGFRVVPISVRALYTQHGTIGCLVNVVARGD